MDRDERMNRPLVAARRAFQGFIADVWTALPVVVESYDPVKRTITAQPTIQAQVQNKTTGAWSNVNLPVLPDVPVLFPGAGDYLMTFPIQVGDEGLVVFASRCIDAFWQQGGVQPQAENRMHDLSDGIFLPGALSQKQEIPDISTDTVQIRSKDGTRYIEATATGFKVKGTLEVDGDIEATGEVTRGMGTPGLVTVGQHLHTSGGTGAPTSVPTPGT